MSKNGAGYDPDIEDVPNDLYTDVPDDISATKKKLFVKKFTHYVRNKGKERTQAKGSGSVKPIIYNSGGIEDDSIE